MPVARHPTAPAPEVALVVPGLLGPDTPAAQRASALAGVDAAALELAAGRGEILGAGVAGFEATLFELFDAPAVEGRDCPVAAVTCAVDVGAATEPWWVRADPVHLAAGSGGVILTAHSRLAVTPAEAARMGTELSAVARAHGVRFEAPQPQRWYIAAQSPQRLCTHNLNDVFGHSIEDRLPGGPDAAAWTALMTEMQTVLHASIVNRERAERGALEVNAVWLWGAGTAPPRVGGGWGHVWSDDALAVGLGRLAGSRTHALAGDAVTWLASGPAAQPHLIVFPQAPAAGDDDAGGLESWRRCVGGFCGRWMAPLVAAARARRIGELRVIDPGRGGVRVAAGQLRRWWRRPVPLRQFATAQRS